ncbi:MAG: metalloregulator ArsR/SmtB family transcription factor [Cytophagales bacterium]
MGISRTDLFDFEQNELAQLARVFSHPARIAIVQYMADLGYCTNGDLVTHLGLAKPTVSQHLRDLKMAGLIKGTIIGNTVSYSIDDKFWKEAKKIFVELFDSINSDGSISN